MLDFAVSKDLIAEAQGRAFARGCFCIRGAAAPA